MIGQTVGNYRIIKLLGEGGMGAVYLAEHPGIGRKAAVKVLHPGLAQNEEVVTRFFNEGRAANAVHHPGIVEVFDFGTLASGATYIIMEFLDGESLAARIRRVGRIRFDEAIEVAAQTAAALGAAHNKGIVHRDLKPDNLFLVQDTHASGGEAVKVLDFGIAKLNSTVGGSGSVKTRTGSIMGTPIYMSPEQCRGTKEVDHRTDIYALGIILYEMICGQPPFVSQGHGELIHMHIATPPQSPRAHNPGTSKELEGIILKALEKQPSTRFQTMDEFQRALKVALAGVTKSAVGAVSRTQVLPVAATLVSLSGIAPAQTTFSAAASMIDDLPTPRRQPRWRVSVTIGGAALILGAGAWFVVLNPTRPQPPPPRPLEEVVLPAAHSPPNPVRETPPEAPKVISVSVTSDPPGARVVRERDGADIGVTPFRETWSEKTGVEKLRIELDGFKPAPFVVPLDRGVELRFGLERAPAPEMHKKKSHRAPDAPSSAPTRRGGPSELPAAPSQPKSPPSAEPVPL